MSCLQFGWRVIQGMGWIFLFTAGLAEIIFAVSLKYNEGFTRLLPSVVTGVTGCLSFYLLTLAIKTIPLGTAYAIWTGIGAVGVVLVGILLFKESHDWLRLTSMAFIIAGILGLKLTYTS